VTEKTKKTKQKVDYEPRSAHGRAVNDGKIEKDGVTENALKS